MLLKHDENLVRIIWSKSAATPASRDAITLIELLLVMALIVAVAGMAMPLLMVLTLLAFSVWHRIENTAEASAGERVPAVALIFLGGLCGGLFLAEYSAGALTLVALVYLMVRFRNKARLTGVVCLVAAFAVVSGP